jgi:hypothetical protein
MLDVALLWRRESRVSAEQRTRPIFLFGVTQTRCSASPGLCADKGRLCGDPRRYLGRDEVPYETSCSFNKRKFVCQAAVQKNADGIVSGHVGRCYERFVFGNPKMGQVAGLG